ncbi:DNA internalization-related competence protein ComEC/Rec2 [Virgibacillus sp. MSJ-26]|uniref:DNA internalization-related competence protein ComEC/Rec2 n=1 Tax=Virgibacillus sp. MSJ-26 TaxID=2841522 RepID=UPI00353041F3
MICILSIYFDNYYFILILLLWLVLLNKFKRLGKTVILLSLTSSLFFIFHIPSLPDNHSSVDLIESSNNLTLIGKITGIVANKERSVQFYFQTENPSQKYLAIYFPNSNNNSNTKPIKSLNTGATCQITGNIVIPEKNTNPGEFNYQHYLKTQGMQFQLVIDSLTDIQCEGISTLGKIYESRETIQDYMLNTYSKDTAAWIVALILGDDSLLEERTIDLFRDWSISHLLAISGLHVGLIVALIYFILIKTGIMTKEKAQWFMLFFLPIYALLAGGEPSVWRASIMVFLFIVFSKLKLKLSVSDVVSIVFLLLIFFDGYIIYHIGFQFSFIVTFSLILSRDWLIQTSSRFFQLINISFVSQMVILPFQFIYFSMVQPLSILLNVIVVPYFSFLIIPGMFLMGILSPLPFIPSMLDKLFLLLHERFLILLELLDKKLNYPWVNGSFPLMFIILYYVIICMLMISINRKELVQAFKYGVTLTLFITALLIRPYFSPYGSVTMLDIGQGDAFIIELPYRQGVIFMDAGATFSFSEMDFTDRVYEQIIKPYLYSKGIQSIDAIFISHEDMDHMGSVDVLVEEFSVDQIYISPYYVLSEKSADVWNKNNVDINIIHKGEQSVINNIPFQVLSPVRDTGSDNENSLVIYTEIGGKSWLFTGDVGVETEKEIMKNYSRLSIDVLKVGHHGSKSSTDESFIKHIEPLYALVSVGENNTYGHPAKEVIDTLEDNGVFIMRTDQQGAIIYKFKDNEGTFLQYSP